MVHSSDVRAGALGQLEALSQRLRVEWGGLGPQSGKPRLCRVLRRRLYHAVEASQHAVQLRTSRQGRHEPAHGGQRGAPQAVTQTSAQPVQEGLTEGGGALLRRRRALEGERGAAAGRTSRVELLHQRHQAVRPKQTKRRRGNAEEGTPTSASPLMRSRRRSRSGSNFWRADSYWSSEDLRSRERKVLFFRLF